MDVGLVAAFAGGALSLLSPCSALLLPAFFASSVGAGPRLALHGAVFYLGLLGMLIPVGIGLGAAGSLVVQHRSALVAATSLVLVVLGLFALFGRGFDLLGRLPGVDRLRDATRSTSGLLKSLLLGVSAGAATFCTGPILGAVLTLAAARGDMAGAAVLMACYAAGIVVPMLVLVLLWRAVGDRGRRLLRGRPFALFGRRWHPVEVITGLLLIAVGVFYWLTDGLVGVADPVPVDVQTRLQDAAQSLASPAVDAALIVAAVGLVLWWWFRARSRPNP